MYAFDPLLTFQMTEWRISATGGIVLAAPNGSGSTAMHRRQLLAGLLAAPVGVGGRVRAAALRDLTGIWSSQSGTPLERPTAFKSLVATPAELAAYERSEHGVVHGIPGDDVGQDQAEWFVSNPPLMRIDGEVRTSIIVDPPDGRLPYSPAGRRALGRELARMADFSGPEARPLAERCLVGFNEPATAPMIPGVQMNAERQFVLTRQALVIRAEANNDWRIVALEEGPSFEGRRWLGVSRGRWEGDTLVAETTRFNPAETLRSLPSMLYLSPDARVTERFRRISAAQLLYGFTIDDPAVFTQPWRGELVFQASQGRMFEYACHEGNYSIANILAGARAAERVRGPK